MIIQIDQLFINTSNITTLNPYVKEIEDLTEFGLIINGVKYGLFATKKKEELEGFGKKLTGIVSTIINDMSVRPVQRLNLEDEKKDA